MPHLVLVIQQMSQLLHSLVCSHRSFIPLLCTVCFACTLLSAHSLARLHTLSLRGSWKKVFVNESNASISCSFNPCTVLEETQLHWAIIVVDVQVIQEVVVEWLGDEPQEVLPATHQALHPAEGVRVLHYDLSLLMCFRFLSSIQFFFLFCLLEVQ